MLIHREKDKRFTHVNGKITKAESEDPYFFQVHIEVDENDKMQLDINNDEAEMLRQKLNEVYEAREKEK